MSAIMLLHGTDHIIEVPNMDISNEHNDYGKGFYCTRSEEMAKEWACRQNTDGFVNCYEMSTDGLKILDLMDGKYTVLNWIALLLKYRTFRLSSEIALEARDYIIEHFSIDRSKYDLIIGYRADDSYFQYAESFVSNGLSLRSLDRALRLGKPGEQTVLISKKAFEQIRFIDAYPVEGNIYYPKLLGRDAAARKTCRRKTGSSESYKDDIFAVDILREELKNDDPRIQRIIS